MTTKRDHDEHLEYCRKQLERLCPPGTLVYTSLEGASRSGLTRWYNVRTVNNGEIVRLTGLVADLCGFAYDRRREAIKVNGCGFDGGFEIVHTLSYKLHGHDSVSADAIEADAKGRPFEPHPNAYRGGYSLRHRSL